MRIFSYFSLSNDFCYAIFSKWFIYGADDASIKLEDSNFTVDVLTRCTVNRDGIGKKTIKIIPLEEPGEPVVVSVSLSQVKPVVLVFMFIF